MFLQQFFPLIDRGDGLKSFQKKKLKTGNIFRLPDPANGLRDGQPGGVCGPPRPLEQNQAVGPPRYWPGQPGP